MADQDKAVFKVVIHGPIEKVWHEITRTDVPQKCMFNMRIHTPGNALKPGAPMQARTKSGKYVGVVGKVLEYDPPRRYSHTFMFTRFDDPPCKVTYDLREVPAGTEFTLTISDLTPGTKTARQMTAGSKLIVNTLKRVVETGKPSFGVRALYVLFGILEPLNPRSTRVENWSLENSI
jgi:uncharacterized protein YndB with AHSA1/START domain